MLQTLEIKNFQSHKNSLIEFDSGVTAIIGLNNHGKSAVLKALRKAIRNDPSGNVFIRNVPDIAKTTELTVLTNNGKIKRVIGKTSAAEDNVYEIETENGEKFKYTKFSKTGIPKEVLDVSGISSPQLFGNEEYDLNFQKQRDDIFLVTGKGLSSIRSKVLSKITGIDTSQRAIQIGRLKERNLNQEIEKNKKEREKLNLELNTYIALDDLVGKVESQKNNVEKLAELEKEIEYCNSSYNFLVIVINNAIKLKEFIKLVDITFDIDGINNIKEKLGLLQEFKCILFTEEALKNKIKLLSDLPTMTNLQSFLEIKKLLEKVSLIDTRLRVLKNIINTDLVNLVELNKIRKWVDYFLDLQCKLELNDISVEEKKIEIESLDKEYSFSLEKLKNLKKELGVCPVCGSNFKEES